MYLLALLELQPRLSRGKKKLLGIRVVYIIFSSGLSRWGGVIYSSTHPHTHTPTHQALVSPEQEREAKEQQELNDLADTDPAEYDRRIKEWRKRKLEGRDGSAGRGVGGGDGDGGADIDEIGDVERRKSLARERREARYSINSSVVANSTWYIYMYQVYIISISIGQCATLAPVIPFTHKREPTASRIQ